MASVWDVEPALVDGVDGGDPESGGENPVEGGRRAAALDMAENRDPCLEPGALLYLLGDPVADAAEAHVAELVDLARLHRHGALLGLGPLGHHHDGSEAALLVALLEGVAHHVDVELLLGDQD